MNTEALRKIVHMLRTDEDVRTRWDFETIMREAYDNEIALFNFSYEDACEAFGCAIGWARKRKLLTEKQYEKTIAELRIPMELYDSIFMEHKAYDVDMSEVTPDMVADQIEFWLSDEGNKAWRKLGSHYLHTIPTVAFADSYRQYMKNRKSTP